MRPIYILIARGHHCSSERSCERCSKARGSPSGGSNSERRVQKRASATSHWFESQRSGGRKGSYHSDVGILEKGGVGAPDVMEMY